MARRARVLLQRRDDATSPADAVRPVPRVSGAGNQAIGRLIQRLADGSAAGEPAHVFASATRGAARDVPFRNEMEHAFRTDFSSVRAHVARPTEMAALGAHAATVGEDVVFASASPGREVVAHELTHVVQQRSVGAASLGRSAVSSPHDAAELEATVVARQVVAGQSVQVNASPAASIHRDLADEVQALVARVIHLAQQDRVYGIIRAGLAVTPDPAKGIGDVDNLMHNSCEWIKANNCDVFVLSRIHDATTRNPGQVGYFDATVKYPTVSGEYPADHTVVTDPHIRYENPGALGGMGPGGVRLTILNPAGQSDASLRETIIHEVQHDADQTWPGQRWVVPGGSAFNDYQSEFRAYWIENGEHGPADVYGSSVDPATNSRRVSFTDPSSGATTRVATNFKNLRQENIFWHLVDGGYAYVPQNYVQVPAFKTMADGFDRPFGGNLINSVRIQKLSEALDSCSPGQQAGTPAVEAMLRAAGDLDQLDRRYLQNDESSRSFWDQARGKLSGAVYDMLHNMVWYRRREPVGDFPAPSPAGTSYA